ncbi:hypothetical protein Acr_25g0010540 [Actinidia rufa]|uniref:Uncharacterized protein n=1 Tax=Actinidia rufa TaxID=165716 RepID=A0A7J0H0U0_9ERIC|nr:hypothetical protein Acr_25g0010540 [Actinidia rufa]
MGSAWPAASAPWLARASAWHLPGAWLRVAASPWRVAGSVVLPVAWQPWDLPGRVQQRTWLYWRDVKIALASALSACGAPDVKARGGVASRGGKCSRWAVGASPGRARAGSPWAGRVGPPCGWLRLPPRDLQRRGAGRGEFPARFGVGLATDTVQQRWDSKKVIFRNNQFPALEITGKWKCPQKSKLNLGPPLKQLRLEQWLQWV